MRWQTIGDDTTDIVRGIRFGVLGAVLLLSVACPAAGQSKPAEEKSAAAGPLAVKNAGFEEGDKSPTGWEAGAPIEGVEYVWDKNTGYKSKASVCIKRTGEKYFPIATWSQTVPHTGKTVRLKLSAWVKAESVHKAILDVGFVAEDGQKSTHQWAAYIGARQKSDAPASHDWQEYSGVVAIPPNTKSIRIGLQVFGPATIWFDNIVAQYVPDDTPVSANTEKGSPKPEQKP